MKTIGLVLLFVALARGGLLPGIDIPENVADSQGRIIQGYPAAPGQFPHQVYLRLQSSSGGAACGGSLISTRYVLTAAHCVRGMLSAEVRFGINVNSPVLSITATRLIPHPSYNPTNLNNDIALIDLGRNVTLSSQIGIITLPRQSQTSTSFESRVATASGFGYVSNNGPVSSTLNYVNLTVISNARCIQDYGSSVIIASTICTVGLQSSAQSTCSGDSGGPLILRDTDGTNIQIGVVSFVSSRGCSSGSPAGFVRPHYFWSWINQQTGIPIRP